MRGLDRGLRKTPMPQTHLRAREVPASPTIPPAPPCPHKDHRTLPSPGPSPTSEPVRYSHPKEITSFPGPENLQTANFRPFPLLKANARNLPFDSPSKPGPSRTEAGFPAKGEEGLRETGSRRAPGNGRTTTPPPASVRYRPPQSPGPLQSPEFATNPPRRIRTPHSPPATTPNSPIPHRLYPPPTSHHDPPSPHTPL